MQIMPYLRQKNYTFRAGCGLVRCLGQQKARLKRAFSVDCRHDTGRQWMGTFGLMSQQKNPRRHTSSGRQYGQ